VEKDIKNKKAVGYFKPNFNMENMAKVHNLMSFGRQSLLKINFGTRVEN
jgi:hypothetical protein